jgi:RNA polymerase sigma-70 factor (ECF subfamily)
MDYLKLSDEELVNSYVKGNSKSFEILMNKYKNRIYSYIYFKVKNKDVAEDIFQETFIKVINSLKNGKYSHDGKFVSWVTRIAHNLTIDFFRKEKQFRTISNSNENNIDVFNNTRFSSPTIEDDIIRDQINDDVKRLIETLPEDQKEIVILRHYVGMSFKEIADYTDVSINTALGRMRYALLNLRKQITEQNIILSIK